MALNFPVPTDVGETFEDEATGNFYTCQAVGPPAVWVTGDGTNPNPDNFVTLNTAQTITGDKTFNAEVTVGPTAATALVTIDHTTGDITTSGDLVTSDLVMSNLHRDGNEVDGTTGHWVLQEGEESLFVINRVSGRRYSMAMTPVD